MLKNGRLFALLKTSSGKCKTSSRPKGVHRSKEEGSIQLLGQASALDGAMVQIANFPSRISSVIGGHPVENSAGNLGSVDVAVSLLGMGGALMTIEQATRKPDWGRKKMDKAGCAPHVLDKRERAVMKRLKWSATLGSCLSCYSWCRSIG